MTGPNEQKIAFLWSEGKKTVSFFLHDIHVSSQGKQDPHQRSQVTLLLKHCAPQSPNISSPFTSGEIEVIHYGYTAVN